MYRAQEVAEYIVTYCAENRTPISHLKLQKILYYTWINYYRYTGQYLFPEEICAWQLGPVVPEVYYAFSAYGGLPITHRFQTNIRSQDIPILNETIQHFLPFSAKELVDLTHASDGAWTKVFRGGVGIRAEIPKDMITRVECSEK